MVRRSLYIKIKNLTVSQIMRETSLRCILRNTSTPTTLTLTQNNLLLWSWRCLIDWILLLFFIPHIHFLHLIFFSRNPPNVNLTSWYADFRLATNYEWIEMSRDYDEQKISDLDEFCIAKNRERKKTKQILVEEPNFKLWLGSKVPPADVSF